jgi:hypothetical protein
MEDQKKAWHHRNDLDDLAFSAWKVYQIRLNNFKGLSNLGDLLANRIG